MKMTALKVKYLMAEVIEQQKNKFQTMVSMLYIEMRFTHVNLVCTSEIITKAVAMWILKSREIHKLPLSVMNNTMEDIQSFLDVIMGSLKTKILSQLSSSHSHSITAVEKIVSEQFEMLSSNVFKSFRINSLQMRFFRQQMGLVVSVTVVVHIYNIKFSYYRNLQK